MKKPFVQADLLSLAEIQSLQMPMPSVLLVPACYMLEARGMTADSPNRAWYTGCTQCKKQLESVGIKMQCPRHGDNKGKKIYAGQVLLADSSHKKELPVWDEMLRRLIRDFLGHEDLDLENVMEDLCQAVKGMELVVRVGVATRKDGSPVNVPASMYLRKDGTPVSLDLFDVAEQVNSDGCLAIYKTIVHDFGQGLPAIAPACCRHVSVNDLGQLILKAGAAERLVDTAKLMVRVVEQEDLRVLDGIDGVEVSLMCDCVCCQEHCTLYAAGLPATVNAYIRIAAGEHLICLLYTSPSPRDED